MAQRLIRFAVKYGIVVTNEADGVRIHFREWAAWLIAFVVVFSE